jgi:hypothetical protein
LFVWISVLCFSFFTIRPLSLCRLTEHRISSVTNKTNPPSAAVFHKPKNTEFHNMNNFLISFFSLSSIHCIRCSSFGSNANWADVKTTKFLSIIRQGPPFVFTTPNSHSEQSQSPKHKLKCVA